MMMRFLISTICLAATIAVAARDLTILHTNDTHSAILPDKDGKGGVVQRKAIIDSIRACNKDVILIDAGDKVQGSLYFKFFKGDVEYPLQNMLGVDISILGNHEFDNGFRALADYEKSLKAETLSTNYDFKGTPAEGVFKPYTIKNIGGKKIGFIGLNIDPESLIAKNNYQGLVFHDIIPTANKTAALLKKKGCDLVVAVTHIGYTKGNDKTTDPELAKASKDIDIIIGGHSHTLVDPAQPEKYPHIVENAEGRPVLVVQSGKGGQYLGQIKINLDNIGKSTPADFDYSLIAVTDRFPESQLDTKIIDFLQPFTSRLSDITGEKVGTAAMDMRNGRRTGAFPNWAADFGMWYGNLVLDSIRQTDPTAPQLDLAIMNVGGIRNPWLKGDIVKGDVLSAFPFTNRFVIMQLSGSDLLETLKVAARKGGEAVSNEVRVVSDPNGNVLHALVGMKEIDPQRLYNIATIDFVAWGNDDMLSMANGKWIYSDENELCVPMLRYVKELSRFGLPVAGDPNPRFIRLTE